MVAVAVVFAAGGFYGGLSYGQTPKALAKLSPTKLQAIFAAGRGGSAGGGSRIGFAGRGGANGGNGFVSGQIISKDDKSITVQLPNNAGTKIVFLGSSSQILKSVSGATTDLATGENVLSPGVGQFRWQCYRSRYPNPTRTNSDTRTSTIG